jgi:hypothetical protein
MQPLLQIVVLIEVQERPQYKKLLGISSTKFLTKEFKLVSEMMGDVRVTKFP